LQDAIGIAEESRDNAVVTHLLEARRLLSRRTEIGAPVRVEVVTGRVFCRGLLTSLPPSELALMLALALAERAVHRDDLAETLYPALEPRRRVNSLKITIHRLRRRLALHGAVTYESGNYGLGDMVDVDLPRVEREMRRLELEDDLSSDQRTRLGVLRRRIQDGRPGIVLDWEWFESTERRLRDLGREISLVLGRDALRQGHCERAIEAAANIARDDPSDEAAAELAIRAFLLAGNRTAAVLEYRRYASLLRREGDVPPSREIRDLFDGKRGVTLNATEHTST
jgi:DNA-binding SARP family transcriptional activator